MTRDDGVLLRRTEDSAELRAHFEPDGWLTLRVWMPDGAWVHARSLSPEGLEALRGLLNGLALSGTTPGTAEPPRESNGMVER